MGSRDKTHDYCSSFCCGYATRQAVLARQILPSSHSLIYMMDDRVFARSFSATYDPLRQACGIRLERCRLSVLREDPATRDLILQVVGEDGKVAEERFGMVVLSVGAAAAAESAALARCFGVEPDSFGFIRTHGLSPADTGRPGVFVAGAAAGPADIADSATQGSAAAARVCEFLGIMMDPRETEGGRQQQQPPAQARIGVMACDCAGEIGSVVDLADVLRYAGSLGSVVTTGVVPFGCLPEGIEQIQRAVKESSLTSVVIGACNRRTFGPLFEKSLGVEVQFVSLREECSAVHRSDPVGATRKARELVRIGVEQARQAAHTRLTTASSDQQAGVTPVRAALVVGGGLAGITAALHLVDAGIPVHLVEREKDLGGNALRLDRSPEGEDIPGAVEALAARLSTHPLATIHASCEVVRREGHVGEFTATIRSRAASRKAPARETRLSVGALVVATGADEHRGKVHGLGSDRRVLTLLDMGQRLREQRDLAAGLRSVAFIGCVGPWDEPGSGASWRCSRGCCETMMRQARAIKNANPACQVAVLVREVNTYALREELYTAARQAGVLFVRFDPAEPPRLDRQGAGLSVVDTALGEPIVLEPDLVVLAAAVLPRAEAARTGSQLDIPVAADGFFREWEPKTRPFASIEPGVFLCGLAAGPKPMREVIAQSLAAGQQALALLSQDRLVPGGTVAAVEAARCAACLTCVRVCPYGVPRVGDTLSADGRTRRRSFIDALRCQGCGACASECPGKAITLSRHGEEQLVGGGLLGRWQVVS